MMYALDFRAFKMSTTQTINTHETIIFHVGVMRYILDAFKNWEDQDDETSGTSIGRFHMMKKSMPLKMRQYLFEIYSHFVIAMKKGITENVPVIPTRGGWKRPDPRFLEACLRMNPAWRPPNALGISQQKSDSVERPFIYNLRWMYYTIGDELFPQGCQTTRDFTPSIKLFDTHLSPIVPFEELTPAECAILRVSDAGSSISSAWIDYKDMMRVPLGRYADDKSRLKIGGMLNYLPPDRARGSIDQALTIMTRKIAGKDENRYEKILKWKESPEAWTAHIRRQAAKTEKRHGLAKNQILTMTDVEYQEEFRKYLEIDIFGEHETHRLELIAVRKQADDVIAEKIRNARIMAERKREERELRGKSDSSSDETSEDTSDDEIEISEDRRADANADLADT